MIHGEKHPGINELVSASDPYPISVVAVPVSDTCKEVLRGVVRRTVSRDTLVEAHGPWVFSRQGLADALERIRGREDQVADLVTLSEVAQLRVRVLTGPWTPTAVWPAR